MHYFSNLFGKVRYTFRTDLLSIIRRLNTVFTAIGICHTSYTSRQATWRVWQIPIAVNTVLGLLMMNNKSIRNMERSLQNKSEK
jgi:hypothetical protein